MEFIPVKHASYEKLEKYLSQNEMLNKQLLCKEGYVVEINDKIEASFRMEEITSDELWLRELYITQAKANALPVLLEMILHLAREKRAKTVYVHSHQPVVDILLEALQFAPKSNLGLLAEKPMSKGTWWSYRVS